MNEEKDRPMEDIMKIFRLGGKGAEKKKKTFRYSEQDLKRLSVEHKWKGNGTENDPFIIESSHPFSKDDIISIKDSRLNIQFKKCQFDSIKIKKCSNLNFQECQIENLTFNRSSNSSISNCKIKNVSIRASVHINIEDSIINSLNLLNSFLNSIKDGSIQGITKNCSPDNIIDVENISEQDKLKGNRFPANIFALILGTTLFSISISFFYFTFLLNFNFILDFFFSSIIIVIPLTIMITAIILIIRLNKTIKLYYIEKRVVYPNLKKQILGGSLIILGIFLTDIFYTINILYIEIWFIDNIRIITSIFLILTISFLFSLGTNLLLKARPFKKELVKEGINPLFPFFLPSITFIIPLILLIGIGYGIGALSNMAFSVNLLLIISLSIFLFTSIFAYFKFKKLKKSDAKLSISQNRFRIIFGGIVYLVSFMWISIFLEVSAGFTIEINSYFIVGITFIFGFCVLINRRKLAKIAGLRLYQKGDYEEALKHYQKMLGEEPNNIEYLINLGAIYSKLKKFEKALNTYNQAIELDQDSKFAWNGLGVVYSHLEQYDKSIEMLEKALSIKIKPLIASTFLEIIAKPDTLYSIDDTIIYNLSNLYRKKGDLNKALETCEKGFEINPKYESLWELYGTIYIEKGEFDKCIGICEQCVKSNPSFEKVYNVLGLTYRSKQNPKKAIEMIRKALEINPKNHQSYFNLALVYMDFKQYKLALNACNLSLGFKPDNPEAIQLRTKIYNDISTL